MVTIGKNRLRKIELEDLSYLKEIRLSEEIQTCVGQRVFLNNNDQLAWYNSMGYDLYLIFEMKLDYGWSRAGYVRLNFIDHMNKAMMVGADLHPENIGHGYGQQVYELIFQLGFRHWGMNRLYLNVLASNTRAQKLYDKLGFKVEGIQRQAIFKDGKYQDYIMMSLLKEDQEHGYDPSL